MNIVHEDDAALCLAHTLFGSPGHCLLSVLPQLP